MFPIVPRLISQHKPKERRITCVTCRLQGCVGRCRFETVECPQPKKPAQERS
jgi:hypothetical protein